MTMNCWTIFKDSLTLTTAIVAAVFGILTFRKNASTRRAEFLVNLHEEFFTKDKYKPVRCILDSDDDDDDIATCEGYTEDEPEEFTEYLNFFELVAYLEHTSVLTKQDVNGLFGYYLQLFHKHPKIRSYIAATKVNGYEHLDCLLAKIPEEV